LNRPSLFDPPRIEYGRPRQQANPHRKDARLYDTLRAQESRLRSRDRDLAAKIENWLECISPENKAILNAKLQEATAERCRIAQEIARIEEADKKQLDVEQAVGAVMDEIRRYRASSRRVGRPPRRPSGSS
jgi:hypothetical protein